LSQAEHVKARERPMRVSLYEYSYNFARRVEQAADRIADHTTDPQVRRAALQWKRGAVTEIQRVAFQEDVLLGVLDAWSFTVQQQQFFESGAGRAVFGDAQPIARATSRELVEALERMVKPWGDDIAIKRGSEIARSWARDNAIEDLSFARRSLAMPQEDRKAEEDGEHGIPRSLANIEDSVEDLLQRMTLYAAQAPRQASWEGERLLDDFLEKRPIAATFDAVGSMRGDMSKMSEFTGQLPALIARERLAAFESVADERRKLLATMSAERVALEETLSRERATLMEETQRMLGTALAAMERERQAAMHDMPQAASEAFRATRSQLESLVDRFLWGLLGIIGVVGAVIAIGILWFRGKGSLGHKGPFGFGKKAAAS